MPITVVAHPVALSWGDFSTVDSLPPGEDAHTQPAFDLQNKPLRRVGRQFMLADTLEIRVHPVARVLKSANQTDPLLAHEQGHYDVGILAARALARDLEALQASSPRELARAADAAWNLHIQTRMGPIQKAYDKDTKHSQDTTEQARWAGAIQAALVSAAATHLNKLEL